MNTAIKFLAFTLLITAIGASTACTTTTKKVVVTKRPPMYKRPQVEDKANTSPATPLITAGIDKLKNEENTEAEWKFEEAINLDPDYGPSYYWLARARYRLDEIEKALNLLDKAKALLRNSEIWLERIEKFRNFLQDKTD